MDQGQPARRQGEELSETPVRRARVDEAEALSGLVLRSKAMWGYDAAFLERCRAELAVRPDAIRAGEVWVAETDGRPAGVLELVASGADMEIRLIFVDPDAARAGIGGALWAHAEARAQAHGSERLVLDADPNAVGFYRRMGAAVVGRSPSGSIPGRTLPRMAKRLG